MVAVLSGRSRQRAPLSPCGFVDALGPLDLSAAEKRSTVVLDRDGRLLRPFATADGRWRLPVAAARGRSALPRHAEGLRGPRFDRHRGVDPAGARCAPRGQFLGNGRVVSGGSTLTMQVARLLEPRDERTLAAKLRQLVRAVQLERRLSKDEILAPLSHARALWRQSRGHARGDARLFRPRAEAPVLRRGGAARRAAAGARDAPPRPLRRRRQARPRPGARPGAWRAASSPPPRPRPRRRKPVPAARRPFPMLAAHAAEAAVAERPARARSIGSPSTRRLQASLETLVRERVERLEPQLSAAILVIDNATGEVRAQVGSAGYLARERAGAIDMTRGAALARLGAEAVHLCARLRERPRPSRDAPRRPALALRRLCARRTSTSPSRARSRRAGRCSCRSTCRRSSSSPRSARRASSPGCGRRGADDRAAEGGARPASRSGSAGSASRLPT